MLHPPVIADRDSFEAAAELLAAHSGGALAEARRLAERSRDVGNVLRFCRWRQAGRLIEVLASGEVSGPLH